MKILHSRTEGGDKMKTILLTVLMMFGVIIARNTDETTGWEYDASTQQAFYMFANIQVDGIDVEVADVLGAFKDGQCIGFTNAIPSSEGGYTTLPLMGQDGPVFGLNGGEVPDEILLYDTSNGSTLSLDSSGELPGFANNEIYIIDGTSTADNTFGCTDATACNYDAGATADDGSCADVDCAGECGGIAEVDECGECGGDGIDDGACDCDGNVVDCAGECGGSSANDVCGECDGDGSSCLGCTTGCADNYDAGAVWDDGSQCAYTVPGISNGFSVPGPSRVILSWDAPASMCDAAYSYNVYDVSGEYVKSTTSTTTQVTGLDAGVEHCFSVVAENQFGSSDGSDFLLDMETGNCAMAESSEGISWGLQMTAEIDGWGSFIETDSNNKLGVAPPATYGWDAAFDIPEPPVGSGNYISL